MIASTCSHIKQFHLPYCKALQDLGYVVDVACPSPEFAQAQAEGMISQVYTISLKKSIFSIKNFFSVVEFLDIYKKKDYDVLITHSSLASFFGRLSLYLTPLFPKANSPKKVITVSHGYLFHEHRGKRLGKCINKILLYAEKLVSRKTDLLLTMNQWDLEQAKQEHLGKEIRPISGMGVPLPPMMEKLDRLDVENGKNGQNRIDPMEHLPPKLRYIAYGGEFSKRKNQSFLIPLLTQLPPEIHLVLAGEGAEEEKCKALAKENALGERVHFLGQVPNLLPVYQGAELIISSSKSEGLPFHLMEAMALGKPILASDTKGHRDLLPQDCLFPLIPMVCIDKIIPLLEHSTTQHRLGEANRSRFLQEFHLEVVMPQVLSHYREIIEKS